MATLIGLSLVILIERFEILISKWIRNYYVFILVPDIVPFDTFSSSSFVYTIINEYAEKSYEILLRILTNQAP
ncbi:hypothetical protein DERP_002001 [Dermatophagoides pteronyssinus]|uniref:Uncharacterized protein n=1 Tax=Dermatophagoides pteronyssinus TaxID=6956 RepID=A0ABQ8JGG3_DERPT|nr:hypothetical protein DERP_002001 [Dermatophagoides pteronyssinus]